MFTHTSTTYSLAKVIATPICGIVGLGCAPLDYPIVLIHGWTDKPTESGTFKVIEKHLAKSGIGFFVPHLARFGSVEERAALLIKSVEEVYRGKKVHLMGHSMGGIVARCVAGRGDLPFEVVTVTTLGSPNRGLKYLDLLPTLDGASEEAEKIRSVLGTDCGGLTNLSTKYMEWFNKVTPNKSNVEYFSWAARHPHFTLSYAAHRIIVDRFYTEHDGLVGVESARWGDDLGPGTHLGTIKGLAHSSIVSNEVIVCSLPHLRAAEIGKRATVEEVGDSWREQMNRRISGHADEWKGYFYARKDRKRHGSHDSKSGYSFDWIEGYNYDRHSRPPSESAGGGRNIEQQSSN